MKDKPAYLQLVEMTRSENIIEKDSLTDTQLALLLQKLLEYLGIAAEKI